MLRLRRSLRLSTCLFAPAALIPASFAQTKRPLTHGDYDGWRSIVDHGLRERPNQKDYTICLQQYFDHYLKGAPAPAWMEKGVPYIERELTELSAPPAPRL